MEEKKSLKKCILIAPPYPPHLSLASTTTTSITIKVKPRKEEETPIHGYTVHYKPEFGDWETTQIGNSLQDYTIENLWCGTRYQLYVRAYNGYDFKEKISCPCV